jgi:hypothetical protein
MRDYKKTPEKFRKEGEKTHGKGKHKSHKVGDRISFKTPKGRTTGKVTKVSKEFYMVSNKDKLYKVNRNSILYSMGYVDAVNRTPTQSPIIKSYTTNRMPMWIRSSPSNDEKFPRRIGADIDNRRRNPFFAAPR